MGLFDRVGLQTNIDKTVGMVCQICYIIVSKSETAYTRRMTGTVPSFWGRYWERVWCPNFEVELVAGFLDSHHKIQHGKDLPPQWTAPLTTPYPRLYMVSFSRAARSIGCPVGDCERRATICTNLQIHFVHRHVRYTVVILEEGNRPHP